MNNIVIVRGTHYAKPNGCDAWAFPYTAIGEIVRQDHEKISIKTKSGVMDCKISGISDIISFKKYFEVVNDIPYGRTLYVDLTDFPLKEVRKLRRIINTDIEIKIVKNNHLRFRRI